MKEAEDSTCGPTCGCRVERYSTSRKCPGCQQKLWLTGNSARAEFRLTCPGCGFVGPMLKPEETQELL